MEGQCFVLAGVDTHSGYRFAFIAHNASAKAAPSQLYNTVSTAMVFHTAMILAKETFTAREFDSGPTSLESPGLTMWIRFLDIKTKSLLKAVIVPVRWQQPGGLGRGSPEGDMCFESRSNIRYRFFHSKHPRVQE